MVVARRVAAATAYSTNGLDHSTWTAGEFGIGLRVGAGVEVGIGVQRLENCKAEAAGDDVDVGPLSGERAKLRS